MACCGGTLQMCFCQSPLVDTPWRLSRSTSICGGSVSTSSSSVHSTRGPQGSPERWKAENASRFTPSHSSYHDLAMERINPDTIGKHQLGHTCARIAVTNTRRHG